MSDERYTFESTRARLEEILVQVRKKDTSLEQSLELLEEGVRLANLCNELIDQTSWRPADAAAEVEGVGETRKGEGPPIAGHAANGHGAEDRPEDDERD